MTDKPRVRVPARTQTLDTFQNFSLRLGLSGPDNALSGAGYGFSFLSRSRVQLDAMYRGSWLVGQAVDVLAEDMTRAGIEYIGDIPPDDIAALQSAGERRLQIWARLCEAVRWARLYGGAIAVMVIDGQDLSTLLRPETVTRGQLTGLMVFDRWTVQPTLGDLVDEPGAEFGLPRYYDIVADAMAIKRSRIHHSRVLRVDGIMLPYFQRISENLWGQSVIERVYDRIVAYDSASLGTAQLAYRAHLRTLKIDGLRQVIATGGQEYEAVVKQMDLIRKYQSSEGLTLLDAADDFQTHTYTFAGLSDVLLQFGQQFSGALGIPLVRLFGQSPGGLNSTGDSDWENYYNNVAAQQESHLRDPLRKLLPVMAQSVLGRPLPDGWDFSFTSLWQMRETDRAAVAASITQSVLAALEAGAVSRATALKELRQQSERSGVWSNIDDEEIDAAEHDPEPASELMPDLPSISAAGGPLKVSTEGNVRA